MDDVLFYKKIMDLLVHLDGEYQGHFAKWFILTDIYICICR